MSETGFNPSVLILLVGVIIVANFLAKSLLERRAVPALVGFSMVPRADIAMIVMQTGRDGGTVPGELYAAMVAVSMGTCMLSPPVVQGLLKRSPRGGERP